MERVFVSEWQRGTGSVWHRGWCMGVKGNSLDSAYAHFQELRKWSPPLQTLNSPFHDLLICCSSMSFTLCWYTMLHLHVHVLYFSLEMSYSCYKCSTFSPGLLYDFFIGVFLSLTFFRTSLRLLGMLISLHCHLWFTHMQHELIVSTKNITTCPK